MLWRHECPGCGARLTGRCDDCRAALAAAPQVHLPGGDATVLAFDGLARRLVLGLKYRQRWAAAPLLVDVLERSWRQQHGHARPDVVTWAPTTAERRTARGADQAQLLARSLARRLGVPARRLLRKTSPTQQTGRSRAQRLRAPSFVARPLRPGLHILLVDDVVTTGATLRAAAQALRAAGAAEVTCLAVAATQREPQLGVRP